MQSILQNKRMSADEIAALINNGEVLGTSGFTPAGYPKVIPKALANRARLLKEKGEEFKITLYTGASTGDELDGELARAGAIRKRIPYQSHPDVRKLINQGEIEFTDLHLSHVAQYIRYGFLPKPTTAIVECVDVTPDGRIYLAASGGMSASYLLLADRIFLELNRHWGDGLIGYHDVYIPKPPPGRESIHIYHAEDRIGTPFVDVPVNKIIGIVETDLPDRSGEFKKPDPISETIAGHIVEFLKTERKSGRLPDGLPYQSGVGNVANAVLSSMAKDKELEPISLYTEVIQDSVFDLIDADKLRFGSTCALTLSPSGQERFRKNLEAYRTKFVIRQQEISNHPEVIRRLGIISMNTALEMDIFGNVNSTHVMGSSMMNGIGGSADFTRNAYLSIYMTPSTAKDGKVSSIVPMVSHVDHNEHSTQIFVTEWGLADLRGLSPVARAREIIKKCAHPDYRPQLVDYLEYGLCNAPSKYTPHVLSRAFSMHTHLLEHGTMKIK